jgi:poly(A) polymerase
LGKPYNRRVTAASETRPRILERADHPVSRKKFDPNVVKVLYRLHRSGHKAYVVGGGVRDLMLGRQPKDWDIGTDARPQRVRRLFRNSRIIGRRFRLVHIYFKDEIIEVSTFRRDPDPGDQRGGPEELLITDDNVFGSEREDAFRRDFTVNAMFYNVADFTVIDHVGGIEDLERRLIRTIGDPDVRFREDPVRMMRACELAGRLGFGIDQATQEAIHQQREEITKASPARLTEELVELLRCGRAAGALHWMMELGLLEVLLPEAYAMVAAGERGLGDFGRILPVIDGLVEAGREPGDTVLLAALLLPSVVLRRHDVEGLDQRPVRRGALLEIVRETLEPFLERFALSRQRREGAVQAILGYHRLLEEGWTAARRVRFARWPHFDDALALLEIRAAATGRGQDEIELWRRARSARDQPHPARKRRRRRRRRRRRKKAD